MSSFSAFCKETKNNFNFNSIHSHLIKLTSPLLWTGVDVLCFFAGDGETDVEGDEDDEEASRSRSSDPGYCRFDRTICFTGVVSR